MRFNVKFLICICAAALMSHSNALIAQDHHSASSASPTEPFGSVWTEAHWASWWGWVEDLYLDDASDEEIYWIVRNRLNALGYAEELLTEIEYPPPYSGWAGSGGGGGGMDPYATSDARHRSDGGAYMPMFRCWPGESGHCPRVDYAEVEPPPAWVATSIMLLGGNLAYVPHPGTRVVGVLLTNVGGVLLIWIEIEDEDD